MVDSTFLSPCPATRHFGTGIAAFRLVQNAFVPDPGIAIEEDAAAEPPAETSRFAWKDLRSKLRTRSVSVLQFLNRAAAVLCFLFAALLFLTIPRSAISVDPDSSWCAVLSYAHEKGWQFGTDITFTYGPAGFLLAPWTTGQFQSLRLFSDIFLSTTAALGLTMLAWRVGFMRRLLPLGMVVLLTPNIYPCADLLIYITLVSWGTLCFVETGRRLVLSIFVLGLFAAFIAPLKMTFLLIGGATLGAVVLSLVLNARWFLACGLFAGYSGTFMAEWFLLGQDFSHFTSFLKNGFAISAPYDQALGQAPITPVLTGAVALAAVAALALYFGVVTAFDPAEKRVPQRRGLLLLWLGCLTFLVWKHGFVRADRFHVGYFLAFVPALILALEAMPRFSVRGQLGLGLAGVVSCVVCALTLQAQFFPGYLQYCARHASGGILENIRALVDRREYASGIASKVDAARQHAKLPHLQQAIGTASVDIFGQSQAWCWFNGFNYHPRQIFQSYSVYSPALMRLNENFYLSSAAPDYVLFQLAPIDEKFGPLEDALVFKTLLANYQMVDEEKPFLLLKRQRTSAVNLKLLDAGTLVPGRQVELPATEAGRQLWLQIDFQPGLIGRARHVLYQESEVRLAFSARGSTNKAETFRAPPIMMKAGFVVSPLLRNTDDVRNYYSGNTNSLVRPSAVALQVPVDTEIFWQRQGHYRLYESELGVAPVPPPPSTIANN